jgi:hypothetical protein
MSTTLNARKQRSQYTKLNGGKLWWVLTNKFSCGRKRSKRKGKVKGDEKLDSRVFWGEKLIPEEKIEITVKYDDTT